MNDSNVVSIREAVHENTSVLRDHIARTEKKFNEYDQAMESLTDAITRVAHKTENVDAKIIGHTEWEEDYHHRDTARHNDLADKVAGIESHVVDGFARLEQAIAENDKNMRNDLSGYFQLENAAVTNGRVLAWLAKWGIVGIALAWLWSNALSPLIKKFGVF